MGKEKEIDWSNIELVLDDESIIYAKFDSDYWDEVWNKLKSAMKNNGLLDRDESYNLSLEAESGLYLDVVNGRKIIGFNYY